MTAPRIDNLTRRSGGIYTQFKRYSVRISCLGFDDQLAEAVTPCVCRTTVPKGSEVVSTAIEITTAANAIRDRDSHGFVSRRLGFGNPQRTLRIT
jgi:hypothetical protein